MDGQSHRMGSQGAAFQGLVHSELIGDYQASNGVYTNIDNLDVLGMYIQYQVINLLLLLNSEDELRIRILKVNREEGKQLGKESYMSFHLWVTGGSC